MPEKTIQALERVANVLAPLPEDAQEDIVSKIEFGVDMFNAGRKHEKSQLSQADTARDTA